MPDVGTDDFTRDANEFLKVLLQLYVMYAAHARAKGQREAEARLKIYERQMKEAREERLREARFAKALDPRNQELTRACELGREAYFTANPHRDPTRVTKPPVVLTKEQAAREPMRWDSNERREHLRAHVSRLSPEMEQVRMLHDIACGKPASAAVERRPEAGVRRARHGQELESRGLERTVW